MTRQDDELREILARNIAAHGPIQAHADTYSPEPVERDD